MAFLDTFLSFSITDLITFLPPVGKYSGDQKKCCADGLRQNKLGYTCERRATFISDGIECMKAFLYCCKEMQKTKMANAQEQMLLARSMDSFCSISLFELCQIFKEA